MSKLRDAYPFIIIVLLSVLFRFAFLDKIPNAVSGDELHYVVTARSVFLTGHDLSGTWNPWSLLWFRYPPGEHQAELPYLLHLISSASHPFSMIPVKLPFAILSVGIVLLLSGIAGSLFGYSAGVATGLVAAVNPWLIVMGRTGYEATPAMFFYLLSFWMILKIKKWNILWVSIPLLLAFYSYIATKVAFVPFVAGICIFAYFKNNKKYLKPYVTLLALSLIAASAFYVLTKADPSGSRLGDLFFPNSSSLAGDVNAMRNTTIASPLMPLIINRYVLYAQTIINKLFRIFSPSYLFVDGDQFFLPLQQGFFYYLDAVFLLAGSIYIGIKHRTYSWHLWLLIAISVLPQLVSTTTGDFSIHLTLYFPFLLIIIGAGVAWVIRKPWALLICIAIYAFHVAGFTETYFYRAPLVGYADFPKRILAKYLQFATTRKISAAVYATSSNDVFQKYLLYTSSVTKQTIPELKSVIFEKSIHYSGIQFLPCQSGDSVTAGETVITDTGCGVPVNDHHQSITRLTDGGENYIIGQDLVCNGYELKRYPQNITFADFDVERLTEKQFCETYISQR